MGGGGNKEEPTPPLRKPAEPALEADDLVVEVVAGPDAEVVAVEFPWRLTGSNLGGGGRDERLELSPDDEALAEVSVLMM